MKTAKLFQVVNSDSEDVALFQSTNSSIDDDRATEIIKKAYENYETDEKFDEEVNYFGIYRVFVNVIDID